MDNRLPALAELCAMGSSLSPMSLLSLRRFLLYTVKPGILFALPVLLVLHRTRTDHFLAHNTPRKVASVCQYGYIYS